jgi:hypothetical protein
MPEKMTINQILSLTKIVRERLTELRQLRSSLAVKERVYFGETEQKRKDVEPQYDIKKVDQKIVGLENFLFLADSSVKTSNAITKLELDVDIAVLLEPLQ